MCHGMGGLSFQWTKCGGAPWSWCSLYWLHQTQGVLYRISFFLWRSWGSRDALLFYMLSKPGPAQSSQSCLMRLFHACLRNLCGLHQQPSCPLQSVFMQIRKPRSGSGEPVPMSHSKDHKSLHLSRQWEPHSTDAWLGYFECLHCSYVSFFFFLDVSKAT